MMCSSPSILTPFRLRRIRYVARSLTQPLRTTFSRDRITPPGCNQTGVAPGTINPTRVAILRGKVKDGNNAALPK